MVQSHCQLTICKTPLRKYHNKWLKCIFQVKVTKDVPKCRCSYHLLLHDMFVFHHPQTSLRDISNDHNLLHQQNQVQSDLADSHPRQHRWLQHRSTGVLPQPEPEEETKPFVLDLKNFPDLANADIGSQNPNIQVRARKRTHLKLVVISVKYFMLVSPFSKTFGD